MKEFQAVEIPVGNGYRGNAQSILRIQQHLAEKPAWRLSVVCEKGLPVLTKEGGFFLVGGPISSWGFVEGVLALHYGTALFRDATVEEQAMLERQDGGKGGDVIFKQSPSWQFSPGQGGMGRAGGKNGKDGSIVFETARGLEVLRFEPDGSVLVRGEKTDSRPEIFAEFVAWLRTANIVPEEGAEVKLDFSTEEGVLG